MFMVRGSLNKVLVLERAEQNALSRQPTQQSWRTKDLVKPPRGEGVLLGSTVCDVDIDLVTSNRCRHSSLPLKGGSPFSIGKVVFEHYEYYSSISYCIRETLSWISGYGRF